MIVTDQTWYLVVWFIYSLLVTAGVVVLILQALTGKNNPEQERARYLPLVSGIPDDDTKVQILYGPYPNLPPLTGEGAQDGRGNAKNAM
jgi:hypothetical protein